MKKKKPEEKLYRGRQKKSFKKEMEEKELSCSIFNEFEKGEKDWG